MQQIKIFTGTEDTKAELEAEVNEWLSTYQVRVIQIVGNVAPQTLAAATSPATKLPGAETGGRRFAPSDLLLVFLYEPA